MTEDHAEINAAIDEYVRTTAYERHELTTLAMNYPDVEEFRFITRGLLNLRAMSINAVSAESLSYVYRSPGPNAHYVMLAHEGPSGQAVLESLFTEKEEQ